MSPKFCIKRLLSIVKRPKKIPHRCKLFLYIEGITEETGELERLIRCVDYMHNSHLKSVKQHTTGNDLLETLVGSYSKARKRQRESTAGSKQSTEGVQAEQVFFCSTRIWFYPAKIATILVFE